MERKLSNKDKAEAYYMRLEGHTLQEIADKYGVTKQAIAQALPRFPSKFYHGTKKCIYPAISRWMIENEKSYSSFSDDTSAHYVTIYNVLIGKYNPTKPTIDAILKVTGLKYEDAFSTEETDNE